MKSAVFSSFSYRLSLKASLLVAFLIFLGGLLFTAKDTQAQFFTSCTGTYTCEPWPAPQAAFCNFGSCFGTNTVYNLRNCIQDSNGLACQETRCESPQLCSPQPTPSPAPQPTPSPAPSPTPPPGATPPPAPTPPPGATPPPATPPPAPIPGPVAGACSVPPPGTPTDQIIDRMNQCFIESGKFEDKAFHLNALYGIFNALSAAINGTVPVTPAIAQIIKDDNALAFSGKMVASLYGSPPASGVQYLALQIQKLNPVQPAYAQIGGIGYAALAPVQNIWTAFRNISYVGFVIVFIVIGFMIMFRARISPQAVATVQDSVPRIVIALILVTFSYAIVGLMIDFMFLILNILITALGATGLIDAQKANVIFEKSIIGAITSAWTGVVASAANTIGDLINKVVQCGPICNLLNFVFGGIAAMIGGIIIGIAALFIMFKIFFMLLMAYVSIIIYTIFAPFLLLFQALPGNNGATAWFKQLVANISVFVVVALMLLLAGMLGGISQFGGIDSPTPPITRGNLGQFPLLSGGIEVTTVGRLIGLGFLFMIPSAAGMIKERLKTGAGVAFGGPGAAALGSAGGFALGAATRSPVGRAIGDTSEFYQRRTAQWIASKYPGSAAPPAPQAGEKIRIRERLPK